MKQPPAFPKEIECILAGAIEVPGIVRSNETTIPENGVSQKAILNGATFSSIATYETGGDRMFSATAERVLS